MVESGITRCLSKKHLQNCSASEMGLDGITEYNHTVSKLVVEYNHTVSKLVVELNIEHTSFIWLILQITKMFRCLFFHI